MFGWIIHTIALSAMWIGAGLIACLGMVFGCFGGL